MQRLTGLPSAPNVTLIDRRKPQPPTSHSNTTFTNQIYIRWCCIDPSNAPGLSRTSLYFYSVGRNGDPRLAGRQIPEPLQDVIGKRKRPDRVHHIGKQARRGESQRAPSHQ